MDNRPIGVFDSGLGGLTALRVLRRLLPREDIIYFADTGRMPYGGRRTEELLKIGETDLEFLQGFDVKLILAACGTLSTTALPALAPLCPVPVLGVIEPAAVLAAKLAEERDGKVAVIATEATIGGGAFQRAIGRLGRELEIEAVACPKLVPLVESGRYLPGDPEVESALDEYLDRIRSRGFGVLLLGCTHYPLMEECIRTYMGGGVALVDSGGEAARAAAELLGRRGLLAEPRDRDGTVAYYTSGDAGKFIKSAGEILGEKLIGDVREVSPIPVG